MFQNANVCTKVLKIFSRIGLDVLFMAAPIDAQIYNTARFLRRFAFNEAHADTYTYVSNDRLTYVVYAPMRRLLFAGFGRYGGTGVGSTLVGVVVTQLGERVP